MDDMERYPQAIQASGRSIYDPITVGDPLLWIPTDVLERLLDQGLRHLSLANLPNRTLSRVVKEHICKILGYPVPVTFSRTQPRFPGQSFDVYAQKNRNLQVWNQQIAPTRRYVIVHGGPNDAVDRVKVISGDMLAALDKTGTLTHKYQARCIPGELSAELVTPLDTSSLQSFVSQQAVVCPGSMPLSYPAAGELLPIADLMLRLSPLVGTSFPDLGYDQERNRGASLHRIVCAALGYSTYQDDGRFPDVRHQLLEVKLQTSSTVDLGLILPSSTVPLDIPLINGVQLQPRDVRYAVFYGDLVSDRVVISHVFLTTGEVFFARFQQFGGRIMNSKLQIHLPQDFFTS